MKKSVFIISGVLAIVLFYVIIRLFYAGGTFLLSNVYKQKTKWDATLECQKISATATNKDWGYKNCLQELMNTIPGKVSLL